VDEYGNPVTYLDLQKKSNTNFYNPTTHNKVNLSDATGLVDEDGNPVYQSMQAATSEVIADLVAEIKSLRVRVAQLETN